MDSFPAFMRAAANRIATSSQATPGVEGYVFDGAEGSQMAFWTCAEDAMSAAHVHEYDEYMVVVQGRYTLIFYEADPSATGAPAAADRLEVTTGQECFIPKGRWHSGEVTAGTRTIHCFGGRRANRQKVQQK